MSPTRGDPWPVVHLGDLLASLRPGFASGLHNSTGEGIPHFRPMNVSTDGRIDRTTLKFVHEGAGRLDLRLQHGDVLFNNTNSPELVGKTALFDDDDSPAFSNHMTRLRVDATRIDAAFLALRLHQAWREGWFQTHCNNHVSQASIGRGVLEGFEIALPPLDVQAAVAQLSQALDLRRRSAMEHVGRSQSAIARLRKALLAAACAGELTKNWRDGCCERGQDLLLAIVRGRQDRASLKSTAPKTGTLEVTDRSGPFPLPANWCWAKWNDLADWITYGFTRPMPHVRDGIPIVTAKNVNGGRIDFSDVAFTTEQAFARLSEKDVPRPGEILLTKDGSIGRPAIVPQGRPFCVNQSVAVVRFGGLSADANFLRYMIEAPFTQALIQEAARGSAIQHIAITAFGNLPVPVPPLEEQLEISRRLDALLLFAATLDDRLTIATRAVDRTSHAILTKAFRGELQLNCGAQPAAS